MEAPWPGNGMDFDPEKDFRMYHGATIPGFPSHPHRGFETITATIEGKIDHADSVGNAGRYGDGDLQWMTAGKGVVHSEMFPLLETEEENPLRLFQIWINLPKKSKMVEPGFAMFWAPTIPKWTTEKTSVTVYAGNNYFGVQGNNKPPPDSWASTPENDVAVFHIKLQPGGSLTIPAANGGTRINRSLYHIEGAGNVTRVAGQLIDTKVALDVDAGQSLEVELAISASEPCELLLLQGRPIGEPVAQHGPFVMNSQEEIRQAFTDYQTTRFGGWPWPRDDMVFDRSKGRFALLYGEESTPSDSQTCPKN